MRIGVWDLRRLWRKALQAGIEIRPFASCNESEPLILFLSPYAELDGVICEQRR